MADRGDAHGQGMRAAVQQGAARIVRRHPCSGGLGDAAGAPWELGAPLKRQPREPLRPLAVERRSTGGQPAGRGRVPASRLHTEHAQRARQTCRQGHNTGPPNAERRLWAGGVVGLTTRAPTVRSAQTLMALYRGRGPVELAIQRWQRGRAVEAWRANASRPLAAGWLQGTWLDALMLARRLRRQLGDRWGRLDPERVGPWGRVWGRRKDATASRSTGALCWTEDAWAAGLKVLVERPRRRQ